MMQRSIAFFTLISFLFLALSGCVSQEEKEANDLRRIRETEKRLYDDAQRQLRSQQWELAAQTLQTLESNFPFGAYAEQAQLELIFAHYKAFNYDACSSAADRFIRLHPRHRDVDYAYYMKGLSSFDVNPGFMDRFIDRDRAARDMGSARESFALFSQLLSLFPESQYAPDAEKRMIYLRNLLARHEIVVANYYIKRKAYLAAANRGRYVLENFQKTPAVPDALAVIVYSYKALGMEDLMSDSLMLLQENYPEHPSLNENGEFIFDYNAVAESNRSMFSRLTFGFFDKDEPPGFDSREVYDALYKK